MHISVRRQPRVLQDHLKFGGSQPSAVSTSASDSTLAYSLEGSNGKGVLLIHGLTGAPAEMRFLAKRLNKQGYTVHVPLLSGHGRDERLLLETSWRDWVASIVRAYDRLAGEVSEVHVAGICLGGMLGVALANVRPCMKTLAVYSITFNHDGWSMPKWYRLAHLLKLVASLPFLREIRLAEAPPFGIKNKRLRDRIESSPDMGIEGALDSFPFGALVQQYGLSEHVQRIAGSVKTPTLIVHAVEDDQSHPRNAERLGAILGGASQIEWLQDSYHMIHVDQERAEVARLTGQFFDKQRAA